MLLRMTFEPEALSARRLRFNEAGAMLLRMTRLQLQVYATNAATLQ